MPAEDQTDHEGADGVGDAQDFGDTGDEHRGTEEADDEQFVVPRVDQSPHESGAVAGRGRQYQQEAEGLACLEGRVGDAVRAGDHRLQGGQVQREEDVLDDDDTEDQAGLRAADPAQVDEDLRDDRGGGDAEHTRQHQGLAHAPP